MDKGIKASVQERHIENLLIVESDAKSHNCCFLHLYRNIVANISSAGLCPIFHKLRLQKHRQWRSRSPIPKEESSPPAPLTQTMLFFVDWGQIW